MSATQGIVVRETAFLVLLHSLYQGEILKTVSAAGNGSELPSSRFINDFRTVSSLLNRNLVQLGLAKKGSEASASYLDIVARGD